MGGKDFDDITLGITALVAKGLVDEDRVGMCGWSYGGYAAAWATTHAKRFAATVMGAGICDWETFSRCVTCHNLTLQSLRAGKQTVVALLCMPALCIPMLSFAQDVDIASVGRHRARP